MKKFAAKKRKRRCPPGMHLKKKGRGAGTKCVKSR